MTAASTVDRRIREENATSVASRRSATRRRHVLSIVILLAVVCPRGASALCIPDVRTSNAEAPADYLRAFVAGLSYVKEAEGRVSEKMDGLDILVGINRAKSDYECARERVEAFINSKAELIRTSASAAKMAFDALADLQRLRSDFVAKSLDEADAGSFKPGTAAQTAAQLTAFAEEAGQMLLMSAVAATYTLAAEDPGTGLMSRLSITATERDEIRKELVRVFGSDVTQGMQAGQSRLSAAAAVIVQVLDQSREPRPEP